MLPFCTPPLTHVRVLANVDPVCQQESQNATPKCAVRYTNYTYTDTPTYADSYSFTPIRWGGLKPQKQSFERIIWEQTFSIAKEAQQKTEKLPNEGHHNSALHKTPLKWEESGYEISKLCIRKKRKITKNFSREPSGNFTLWTPKM
jgi:hypothetical protein